MSLHLIFSPTGAKACLHRCSPDDRFVLLGDGVYAANRLKKFPLPAAAIDMIDSDAEARGITENERGDIRLIDYKQLVELTEEHSLIVSWRD